MGKLPQDRGDDVQTMLVRRGTGRQCLHTADDGRGTELQVEVAGSGALPRVQEGICKGVTGGAPSKHARCGERGVRAGGQ